ncbi:MAG TPA: hypothetical protein VFE37_22310 [Chloroflexota bacterium]|nr:hypothetical protein [Chloroflexota bacterium]
MLQGISGLLVGNAGPHLLLPAWAYALPDAPGAAHQPPGPPDVTPSPSATAQPEAAAPSDEASGSDNQPAVGPAASNGPAEMTPAGPLGSVDMSLPVAIAPGSAPGALGWPPPPSYAPPPFGGLLNPIAALPPIPPPLLPPALPRALIVIRSPSSAPIIPRPAGTPTPATTPVRTATTTPTAAPASAAVPCRDVRTIRELAGKLRTVTNARTGQTVEYLVVGDGARSNELLVFFNGTSQIIPDWPTQMITNSVASPLITTTASYSPAEDSAHSLCHDYRLVFFDYPGVGLSPATTGVTSDQIASDVDAMLADVGQKYQLPTNNVSVIGWSLGTLEALKYAFLSPVSNPSRTIHNVALIASKPGGGQSDQTNGNGAQCIDYTFTVLENPSISAALRLKLEANNFQLLFPFQGQQPNNGPSSGCTVDINTATDTVTLSVTPAPCGVGTVCGTTAAEFAANRLTFPWSRTGGISQQVLVNQRQLANDWSYSYCPAAGPNFTSLGCSSLPSEPPQLSATNGGVCQTSSPTGLPNHPTSSQCVPLQIQGSVTVVNGPEDLYIQHTYGAALVAGYQRQFGVQKANLVTYSGADGAGHGILLQHPKFVQDTIFAALQTTP